MSDDRVLMISPVSPLPTISGGQLRLYNVLKSLAKLITVDLATLVDSNAQAREVANLDPLVGELAVRRVHRSGPVVAAIRTLIGRRTYGQHRLAGHRLRQVVHDLLSRHRYRWVWLHFLDAVDALPAEAWHSQTLVLDQHNVDSRTWERFGSSSNPFVRWFARRNARRVLQLERSRLPEFAHVLPVSVDEADYMTAHGLGARSLIPVPNGVDAEVFAPAANRPALPARAILFCGGLGNVRNAEAIVFFARSIFPRVRAAIPDARLEVVGRTPRADVLALERLPGIRVHRDVPDVRPFYDDVALSIAPFRLGGGTKLKIFESLAMEVPVVSTHLHGIPEAVGRGLIAVDEDETMARAIIDLLNDPGRSRALGATGRVIVQRHYCWDAIVRRTVERLAIEER